MCRGGGEGGSVEGPRAWLKRWPHKQGIPPVHKGCMRRPHKQGPHKNGGRGSAWFAAVGPRAKFGVDGLLHCRFVPRFVVRCRPVSKSDTTMPACNPDPVKAL